VSLFLVSACGTSTTPSDAATTTPCRHASDCPRAVCIAGACAAPTMCTSSRTCAGLGCDVALATCVECVVDGDCGAGSLCRADVCVPIVACASDRECSPVAEVCDTTAHTCAECNVDAD